MMNAKLKVKSLACWFLIAATCPQVLAIAPFQAQNQAPAKSPVSANPTNSPNQAEPNNAIAVASRITDINTSVSGDRLNLTLNFASSDRPQVTYTRQGKSWVALLNGAQLQLGNGNASYAKANPAAGITSIEATQYAANKVQIRVNAADPATLKDLIKRQDNNDSLVFSLEMQPSATQPNSISSANAPEAGVLNSQNAPEANKVLTAQNTTANSSSVGQALFQPKVTITNPDGKTRVAQSTAQNSTPPSATNPVTPQLPGRVSGVVPPFRPIKTPPVGDIATTTAKLRADIVELGTAERVPRITLRNAPAIEVLTLIGRVAGLSVVSADSAATPVAGAAVPVAGVATATSINKPVSLDIENETAQDVFNNVLRITGLDANRIGNTIFVATKLPVTLKNLITKSYRLNQITSGEASAYLIGLGASRVVNRQRPIPGVQTATVGSAATTVVNVTTESVPTLETVAITPESGATALLKGVQVIAEERGNTVTLIGSPRQVEFAEAQLARLDTRKRQVSINVRIVDVQLFRNQSFSSQFSFGVGDSFYTVKDGVAVANFGQYTPAPSAASAQSLTSVPTVANPFGNAQSFIDFTSSTPVPQITPGVQVFVDGVLQPGSFRNSAGAVFNRLPISSTTGNPFQSRVTGFTPATPDVITVTNTPAVAATFDPITGAQLTPFVPAKTATTTALGAIGSAVQSLSSLFQYPTQFLQALQFQVQSGNAKVLTDPTLTVQEGESASVGLTQDVPAGSKVIPASTTNGVTTSGGTEFLLKEAGLTLNIQVDRIDDNGFVNMSLSPTISSPVQTIVNPDGSQQVLLSKRTLNSGKVRLRDGQTLILSGVIQDTDRETITKVPILGDLPIIGALFRGSSSLNTRSEVVIIVTPRIMDDSQNSTFGYTYQPGSETQKVLDSNQVKPQ
jgi:type IV pilus assembly protein PilQ